MPEYRFLSTCLRPLISAHHVVEDDALGGAERLEDARAVVDDADRGREAQLARPPVDRPRIFRILDAAAHDRIDVDVEVRVLGKPLQLGVEQPQALLGHFVRLDVVDADLQVVEPRVVERLDALGRQQIAVGDEPGDHAVRRGCGGSARRGPDAASARRR